jgi:hypothetical protein
VHDQLLHLIVVSERLDYFDHVHPLLQPDGSLVLTYTFPSSGRYLLYADMSPRGDRAQIFRLPIEVSANQIAWRDDETEPANRLTVDVAPRKLVPTLAVGKTPQDSAAWMENAPAIGSTMQVEMITQPRNPLAGLHATLLFRTSDALGRAVTDLRTYLGAMGHCVILSEDTREYLHCHPTQLTTPGPNETGGPTVAFHTRFPKPGRYRVWAQFRRGDTLIIAPFTVEVSAPPVPASVLNVLLGE